MNQDELLAYAVRVLERLDLQYFVTGSIAAMYYGEPRFTNDIDLVVDLEEGKISALVATEQVPDAFRWFQYTAESAWLSGRRKSVFDGNYTQTERRSSRVASGLGICRKTHATSLLIRSSTSAVAVSRDAFSCDRASFSTS